MRWEFLVIFLPKWTGNYAIEEKILIEKFLVEQKTPNENSNKI